MRTVIPRYRPLSITDSVTSHCLSLSRHTYPLWSTIKLQEPSRDSRTNPPLARNTQTPCTTNNNNTKHTQSHFFSSNPPPDVLGIRDHPPNVLRNGSRHDVRVDPNGRVLDRLANVHVVRPVGERRLGAHPRSTAGSQQPAVPWPIPWPPPEPLRPLAPPIRVVPSLRALARALPAGVCLGERPGHEASQ